MKRSSENPFSASNVLDKKSLPRSCAKICTLWCAEIREFKELMDDGIISAEEFEAKKRQLLDI